MRSRTLPCWPALAVLLCVLSLALWNGDGVGGAPAEARNPDGFALNEKLPERSDRGVTDPEQFVDNADPGAGRPEVVADGANAVAATVDRTSLEKALGLTQDDMIKIQRGLGLLGFDPGPADGMFGPRSRDAIYLWQKANGIGATGYLVRDHVDALIAVDEAAQRDRAERDRAAQRLSKHLKRWLSPTAVDENGWTDLHYAALLNVPELVEALNDAGAAADVRLKGGSLPLSDSLKGTLAALGHGAALRGWNADGETPLMIAVVAGSSEAAVALAERGADINAKNDHGDTALHFAASKNAREIVEWLVEQGADVAVRNDDGETPLHVAARSSARETAAILITRGANIHARDRGGRTPLHWAARSNAWEIAERLIAYGVGVDATNNVGDTPLHVAAWGNARKTAELLVGSGADIAARDDDGNTPLHEAAWRNAHEMAEWLVAQGAEINSTNNKSCTPLEYAGSTSEGDEESRAAMHKLLLGLDETDDPAAEWPEAAVAEGRQAVPTDAAERSEIARLSGFLGRPLSTETREGGVGWTDLHYAAVLNLPDAVDALIDAGVLADVPLEAGWIPFGDGLKQTLRTLGHEAFETWAADGETPLMIAAAANAREAAEALVARGADIGATSANGDTPLLLAAWGNARETAEWLAAQGADIGATNYSGDTPLHWAALGSARETAEWLIARGANINATNYDGKTPLDYATVTTEGDEESRAATQALLRRLGGKTAEELK